MDDFVLTIDSEDEAPIKTITKKLITRVVEDEVTLDPDFNFDPHGGMDLSWGLEDVEDTVQVGTKPKPLSVDDIIERRMGLQSKKRKRGSSAGTEDSDEGSDVDEEVDNASEDETEDGSEDGFGMGADDNETELNAFETESEEESIGTQEDDDDDPDIAADDNASASDESEAETQAQKDRKTAFFAPNRTEPSSKQTSFLSFNLSRPLLRAITALNFTTPTPIQSSAIPVALEGIDVLGSAVTGSGKTAAFMIPILERLMFRDKSSGGEIRVLILVPTRELAIQCADVSKKLAQFMDITFGIVVGGLSVKAQETVLKSRPDIVIATPGRLIDHLHNTSSFSLSSLDILVLDEADRMLSDGFAAELSEIIQSCPKSRQTMLFSATLTDDVDSLVKLSMNRPVRLFVDPKKSVARRLVQEFVRVRKEADRQGTLVALCNKTARKGVIVFFRSKALCHQMKVVFGLLGMTAAELHGNLSQEQRLESLRLFRDGQVDYLLATDLASRGLDIKGVQTVINYDMPKQVELYLHRVGRTARASNKGRSISLVGEGDRKMLKSVMKKSSEDMVKHRVIDTEALKVVIAKLEDLKEEVSEVLKEEKEEKAIRLGEMEIKKTENMLEHHDEIYSRPRRTWFMTEKEKANAEKTSKGQYDAAFQTKTPNSSALKGKDREDKPEVKRDKYAGLSRKVKRRKLAMEEDTAENSKNTTAAAIRSAKKAQRPSKIGEPERRATNPKKEKRRKEKERKKVRAGGFDKDIGSKGLKSREGFKAKRTDGISLGGKKKGSKKGNTIKGKTKR